MSELAHLPISPAHPARAIHVTGEPALLLRPMLMTDANQVSAAIAASRRELGRFMPWAHVPQTPLDQLERLRQGEADYYAGRDLVMGLFRGATMLAMVGLHPRVPLNPRGLEVGYWAPTAHAGQGFTTLAVQIATLYAFDHLECDRLQVSHDAANRASERVIEKVGFVREGVLRNLVARPTEELRARGLTHSGMHPLYALWPELIGDLPWAKDLRQRLRYENLAGYMLATRSD